jgi:ribosomal protein S18 acetylase RimI-like enzyme
MDTTIRHYQPSDQIMVCQISADTAFFGEPVEAFLEDRRIYNNAFTRYYTDFEAPFVWVADSLQGVIGFLLGCSETSLQSKRWRRYVISKVLVRAISGKYNLGRRTISFAYGMLVGLLRGEEPKVDLIEYPAHLQIDIKTGYRGIGVGKQLMNSYLEQLRQSGIFGVHLGTTSHNEAACHMYENIGFRLLDSRPNQFWTKMLGFDVENRMYGLKLR